PVARILGACEVRVFARAIVQCLLSPLAHPQRGAGRCAEMARGGGDICAQSAHTRTRPHGHRGTPTNVRCDVRSCEGATVRPTWRMCDSGTVARERHYP